MFAVPCPGYGCQNTMRPDQKVCGACQIRIANEMRREEARSTLYIREGIQALGRYLEKWAAFETLYGPN